MQILDHNSRLEAFSDAVFAFAATLLVVSLEVPRDFSVLREQLLGFFSFGVSFFALILIWKVHYNFFRRTDYLDNWVIAFNSVLLFVILYFVYPLKFLANLLVNPAPISIGDFSLLFQLYSLGFALLFSCLSLMYWRASRHDPSQSRRAMLWYFSRHFAIFVGVALFSILLAYSRVGLKIGLPGMIYMLLGPLCYWHGKRTGHVLHADTDDELAQEERTPVG